MRLRYFCICESCGATWFMSFQPEHYYCPRPDCMWLMESWAFTMADGAEFPELEFPELDH